MIRKEWSKGKRVLYIIDDEHRTVTAAINANREDALNMFNAKLVNMLNGNGGGPIGPIDNFGEKKYMLPSMLYKGKAKCHPDDKFDEEFGKRLALARAKVKYHRAMDSRLWEIYGFIDDLRCIIKKSYNKHYRNYLDQCAELYNLEKQVGC